MRVVVTGAAGFVGSHLVERFLADGDEVVGVDCLTDYYDVRLKISNLTRSRLDPRFTFVPIDIRLDDLAPVLEGADVVVNEAATPGLTMSWEAFDLYQSTNVVAVQRLVDACLKAGVQHLVQASTSSVYGRIAVGDESGITAPASPYGVTKLAAEHLLAAYASAFGLQVTVLRYFSVYGPRQRPDMAFTTFCKRLLRGETITIYGDGSQSRSNTYVADCVEATVRAARARASLGTINIGGTAEVGLLEGLELLAKALGVRPVVEYAPPRPGDQLRTVADLSRARARLDWMPQVLPEEGLVLQAQWALDHDIGAVV